MNEVGRRLPPARRRSQLIDVGADLFAANPYEDVLMEDVAALAGVSRALLYRYFPSKRVLFASVFERQAQRLLDGTRLDADAPLADQVRAGLEAHLDYFDANRHTILTVNRGALAGDPTLQAIVSDELAVLRDRLVEALAPAGDARRLVSLALHGWLAFVRAVCVEWLERDEVTRAEVLESCLRALRGMLPEPLDRIDAVEPAG